MASPLASSSSIPLDHFSALAIKLCLLLRLLVILLERDRLWPYVCSELVEVSRSGCEVDCNGEKACKGDNAVS